MKRLLTLVVGFCLLCGVMVAFAENPLPAPYPQDELVIRSITGFWTAILDEEGNPIMFTNGPSRFKGAKGHNELTPPELRPAELVPHGQPGAVVLRAGDALGDEVHAVHAVRHVRGVSIHLARDATKEKNSPGFGVRLLTSEAI